jgi:hypothetical protein
MPGRAKYRAPSLKVYPESFVFAQHPPSFSLASKSFTLRPFRESSPPADNPDRPPPIIATVLIMLKGFSLLIDFFAA